MKCKGFYATGRSLVKKHPESEFAILGMNVGDSQEHIQEIFSNMPWRSFFFGHNYKVLDSIGVNSYPVYIVLDQDQKIRSISRKVDHRAIEELLKSR